MLQPKDTHRISEIKTQFDQQNKIADRFLHWLSFFEFRYVYKPLNLLKKKGYVISELLGILLIVSFASKTCMYSLLKKRLQQLKRSGKRPVLPFEEMDGIDWEKLLSGFLRRFLKLSSPKGAITVKGSRCLIVDDTLLEKMGSGKKNIGRLWGHVSMRYILGYRMLVLGYFDGKSFLSAAFSFTGKRPENWKKPG